MNSAGLLYPTYSWFSLSALNVLPCKCNSPLFLVFWDRQNKSVWLAKMLILCAHENVGGIRSFLQIWLRSPEPKLSFKKLMKSLALLVAKITMLQFVFCRGYLVVSKPEKLQLNHRVTSFLYLSYKGAYCKMMHQGYWCATDLETEENFTQERPSERLIQPGGGFPCGSAIFCLLSTPHCSLPSLCSSFIPQPFLAWFLHEFWLTPLHFSIWVYEPRP